MNNRIKEEMNKIEIPEELDSSINEGFNLAEKDREPISPFIIFKRYKKSLAGIGIGLIFCFLLLNTKISSTAISIYASEIPFISDMFNVEPLSVQLYKDLEKEGYNIENIDIGVTLFPERELRLDLNESEEYIHLIEDNLKQTVTNFLNEAGFVLFQINVTKQEKWKAPQLTNSQQKQKEEVEKEINQFLTDENIEYESLYVSPIDKNAFIEISSSTNDEEELREYSVEIKQQIITRTDFKNYDFQVMVAGSDVKADEISSFQPMTDLDMKVDRLAMILTEQAKYKVIGYSYKEEPLTFIIDTSVESTNKEHVEYLKNYIEEYLDSNDIKPALNTDIYQLIIYSKDGKQMYNN